MVFGKSAKAVLSSVACVVGGMCWGGLDSRGEARHA